MLLDLLILNFASFVAGVALTATLLHHAHQARIRRMRTDALHALEVQAKESYRTGWLHCLQREVTPRNTDKIAPDATALIPIN